MKLTILSPLDLKPGATDPTGRVVKSSKVYADPRNVVAEVTFEDGTSTAMLWPNGSGWTVDGRTAE